MPSIALCVSCYLAYLAGSLERKQASWANQWLLSQLSVSQLCFIPLSLRVVSHEIMTQDADDSRRCLRHTRSIKLIVCGQRSATDNGEIHRARLLYHSRSSLSLGTFGRTEKIWQAGPDMIQHILNESIHLPAPFVVGRLHPDHQISINNATLLIIEGGHFDTYQVIFRNPFSLFTTPPPHTTQQQHVSIHYLPCRPSTGQHPARRLVASLCHQVIPPSIPIVLAATYLGGKQDRLPDT